MRNLQVLPKKKRDIMFPDNGFFVYCFVSSLESYVNILENSLLLNKNQNDIDLKIVGTTHPGEYAGKAGHAALSSVGHDPDQLGAVVGRVDLPVATSSPSSSSLGQSRPTAGKA